MAPSRPLTCAGSSRSRRPRRATGWGGSAWRRLATVRRPLRNSTWNRRRDGAPSAFVFGRPLETIVGSMRVRATSETRTRNPVFTKDVLYRLS